MGTRTSTKPSGPAFASAVNVTAADEMLDKRLAFRPFGVEIVETRLGMSEATICQVLVIDDYGVATDLGERPIFWQVVRRQLASATTEVPWVAGLLVQSGQAYRLDPLTDDDAQLVRQALDGLSR